VAEVQVTKIYPELFTMYIKTKTISKICPMPRRFWQFKSLEKYYLMLQFFHIRKLKLWVWMHVNKDQPFRFQIIQNLTNLVQHDHLTELLHITHSWILSSKMIKINLLYMEFCIFSFESHNVIAWCEVYRSWKRYWPWSWNTKSIP
jgi:hypothetical protein